MTEHDDLFTAEHVDEQIEHLSQAHHAQPQVMPGTRLIGALENVYRQEAEKEALFLHRAWERIAAFEDHHQIYHHENARPIEMQQSRQVRTPGVLTLDQRTTRTPWQRISILAAVIFLALLVGSMSLVFNAARSGQSGALGHPVTTPTHNSKLGTTIYTYTKQAGAILSLDWSPDGKRIVSTGETMQMWDATTGQHVLTFNPPNWLEHTFFAAKWSPDGKRIAAASNVVQVWDVATRRVLVTFASPRKATCPQAMITAPSPAGSRYSPNAGGGDTIAFTAAFSPMNPAIPQSGGGPEVYALAWSPDGRYIVSTPSFYNGCDHAVLVWNASTGKLITTYTGHTAPVAAVAWSPDGKYIASAGGGVADRTVQVWNAFTGQKVFTYHNHTLGQYGAYVGVAWSPDAQRIASYDSNGTTQLWDALTGAHIITLRGAGSAHLSAPPLAWSPDGKRIATVGTAVQIWDATTGKLVFTYRGHTNAGCSVPGSCVRTIAWSPDGKYIASADEPKTASTVKVWVAG